MQTETVNEPATKLVIPAKKKKVLQYPIFGRVGRKVFRIDSPKKSMVVQHEALINPTDFSSSDLNTSEYEYVFYGNDYEQITRQEFEETLASAMNKIINY
jgi:hypothetical protein